MKKSIQKGKKINIYDLFPEKQKEVDATIQGLDLFPEDAEAVGKGRAIDETLNGC
jgi:hypothetical protein